MRGTKVKKLRKAFHKEKPKGTRNEWRHYKKNAR